MKKIFISTCIVIITVKASTTAQDLINPYKDFNGTPPIIGSTSIYRYPPTTGYNASNPNGFLFTPAARQFYHSSQYSGEYMICLRDHPWYINPVFQNLAKTFKIEVVSFPFT